MKRYILLVVVSCVSLSLCSQPIVRKADSLLLNSEYDAALKLLNTNSGTNDATTRYVVENKKAEALTRLGKLDEAEKILNNLQAEKNVSASLQGITKTNLGFLLLNQGRNDRALETLQQAIQDFEKENKSNSLEAAQAMTYLGL